MQHILTAVVAIAVVAYVAFAPHEDPLPTKPEADGIELYFVQHFPEWRAASCQNGMVDDRHFITCRSALSDAPGAVFLLEPGRAIAVNGKAIQAMQRGRASYMDGRPLPVERWIGGGIDVAAVQAKLKGY